MIEIEITRTNSENPDFRSLEKMLDDEMRTRYGELQKWYGQFNIIDSKKTVVVAYSDGKPVGCGCFKEFDSTSAEIKRMFVVPGFRGTGIAEKILLELESWAIESGYSATVLETAIKQPEAIRFYTRLGYKRIDNYGQYAGVSNSLCFRKLLTSTPLSEHFDSAHFDSAQ